MPVFTVAIFRVPSKKVTDEIFAVSLASTTSRAFLAAQALACGAIQVIAGPLTTVRRNALIVVFGSAFGPIVLTFFASWLSEASVTSCGLPASSASACAGIGMITVP